MGHLNRNLYAMLQFIEQPKTLGLTSKKTLLSLKGISCLQVILCWSGWNKCWYGSIYKEMELEMDCLTSRRLLQKICCYKCQFCTKVWAGQNVKKKYLMCQIPIKMLKQHATPNSSLHNLNIYSSKGCRKASMR